MFLSHDEGLDWFFFNKDKNNSEILIELETNLRVTYKDTGQINGLLVSFLFKLKGRVIQVIGKD